METQTRYDLNADIEKWRSELAAQPNLTPEVRRELETHLRDAIAGFQQRGLNDEESLWLACKRVGELPQLGKEFKKVMHANPYWNRRLAIAAWALFVFSFLLPSYDNMLGWQCAILQQYFWPHESNDLWMNLHYQSLTLANLLMLVSPFLLSRFSQSGRLFRWLRLGLFVALVLVWAFILELLFQNDGNLLKIGSFVWASSFALLYLSMLSGYMPNQIHRKQKRA